MLLALLVGTACLVLIASYRLYDTDLWHLLAVGRAIWTQGLPATDQWTWTRFGEPAHVSSWAFRALIWPLWSAGGVEALFGLRWLVTIATFALLFATARRLGARGFTAVVVLVWCALDYRLRTDIRPEIVATLLFATQLWILERHRRTGEERAAGPGTWWIVGIACLWANVHISYYLGFVLLGLYLADALVAARFALATQLARVTLAAALASLVNPYGWEALIRPFLYAFSWRNDPMFASIAELQPTPWTAALQNGQWIWPALVMWRAWRGRRDVVEIGGCVLFSVMALASMRFVATLAVFSGPFIARALEELARSRPWPVPRLPLAARGAVAAVACVALCLPEWIRPDLPLGIGLARRTIPERACDFMAARGVRGRGFNHFHLGGYLPYRFWGDRGRLPFMSTQPELARAEDRALYVAALVSPEGWAALDSRHHFDWVLLDREPSGEDELNDVLDGDPAWAMVFTDDAAQLFVRREGSLAAVADSFAYRIVPGGRAGRYRLGIACERDPELRARAEAELDRMIAASPLHGGASHLRGVFALMDGDRDAAREHLERALQLNPLLPGVHFLLGDIALEQDRPRDALREFAAERRRHTAPPGLFLRTARAWQHLGDLERARDDYRRELARDPTAVAARESLAALEADRR